MGQIRTSAAWSRIRLTARVVHATAEVEFQLPAVSFQRALVLNFAQWRLNVVNRRLCIDCLPGRPTSTSRSPSEPTKMAGWALSSCYPQRSSRSPGFGRRRPCSDRQGHQSADTAAATGQTREPKRFATIHPDSIRQPRI